MFGFAESLKKEIEHEKFLLERLDAEEEAPIKGALRCVFTGQGQRYYFRKQKKEKLLGDEKHPIVQRMKKQRYRKALRKVLLENLKVLQRATEKFLSYGYEDIEARIPQSYRNAVDPFLFVEQKQPVKGTENKAVNTQANITVDGTVVRSKSEALIYNLLLFFGIPFEYERRLELIDADGFRQVRYPDFTIFLRDGTELYWEHFGAMDRPNYLKGVMEKLELYLYNHITLGDNLFVTADTIDHTFNCEVVEEWLKTCVLPKVEPTHHRFS